MRHAIIGTGYWGKNHVRVAAELVETGELDSVVLCDVDENRASDLADSYGFEYETDSTDLDVDTAVIATPTPAHHEITTDMLNAGTDCLVEKPLAGTAEDAWDLVSTAEDKGRTLGVGHIFRYHPALRELRKRIERGDLGRIKYMDTTRYSYRVPRSTAGTLYSLAVHDVDIYNMLMQRKPESIYCRLDSHVRDDIDETATIVFEYEHATGVISESWQIPVYGKRRDLIVVGTERVAFVDYLEDNKIELYDSSVVEKEGALQARQEGSTTYEVEDREPLKAEVKNFLTAVEEGTQPDASGAIGAKAVAMLEDAERAAKQNEIVHL